jgi:hypothetical protein
MRLRPATQHNGRSKIGEPDCNPGSNPASTAGDQRHFTCELLLRHMKTAPVCFLLLRCLMIMALPFDTLARRMAAFSVQSATLDNGSAGACISRVNQQILARLA